MKYFINPILLIIIFLHHAGVSLGQTKDCKYPDWVYLPHEKKGMISAAIAYVFGDNQYEAMENVKKKFTRQLYTHLSNTILAFTSLESESQCTDSSVIHFRNELITRLTEETSKTQRREM
ncbi:MAG TPA: hypothetical protein PK990_06235 [Salinivirgaceae bacterium]|nr:hypothetical protein [Salinivirgaceae bacterium]